MSKLLLLALAQVLFAKIVLSQCAGSALNKLGAPDNIEYSEQASAALKQAPTYGGTFVVTSSSPIEPTGVRILAEGLLIDGNLLVTGKLPFTGTVGLDGTLPANGQSSVQYSCGDESNIGMVSESSSPAAPTGQTGLANGPSNGILQGISNGIPQRILNGIPQGVPNGLFNPSRLGNANAYRQIKLDQIN